MQHEPAGYHPTRAAREVLEAVLARRATSRYRHGARRRGRRQ